MVRKMHRCISLMLQLQQACKYLNTRSSHTLTGAGRPVCALLWRCWQRAEGLVRAQTVGIVNRVRPQRLGAGARG